MRYPLKIDPATISVRLVKIDRGAFEIDLVIMDAEDREVIAWPGRLIAPGDSLNVQIKALEVEVNLETMRF